jgi:hypothetical protein
VLSFISTRFKPAGSLRGMPRNLRLMVFLDTTRNSVAIKEAYNRNIPTIALVNTTKDLSLITYPVLARDFRCCGWLWRCLLLLRVACCVVDCRLARLDVIEVCWCCRLCWCAEADCGRILNTAGGQLKACMEDLVVITVASIASKVPQACTCACRALSSPGVSLCS